MNGNLSNKNRKNKESFKLMLKMTSLLLPGFNHGAIRQCMAAAKVKKWLFVGTSHVRNLIETLSALVLNEEVTKFRWNMDNLVQPTKPLPNGLNLSYIRDNCLARNLTSPFNADKFPDIVAQYDAIVLGRYMWDLDKNNTFPHDYFVGIVDRLEDILRRFQLLSRQAKPVRLKKIFMFMPYALKELEEEELFLTNQLQCRTNSRIQMYRRMVKCAAHYANTKSRLRNSDDIRAPKVELFDTFEFTRNLPNSAATGGANHYHYQYLQSMLGQLFERHICPGREIARRGFNTKDALRFDKYPWARVDEDCTEVFDAFERKDTRHMGPIGPGVMKGQLLQSPTVFVRDKIHLYRNYTPVNNETGEVQMNGLRIIPAAMRPIDKLYQNSFDRLAMSCSLDRRESNLFVDGELLRSIFFVGSPSAKGFFCKIKQAFERNELLEGGLPTYLNMTQMSEAHWADLLSLLLASCSKVKSFSKHLIVDLRESLKMCLFNLGGRAEDMEDSLQIKLYLSRDIRSKRRFMCQCSGVFAPHLMKELEQNRTQTEAELHEFCNEWLEFENKIGLKKPFCNESADNM